jgi:hypothetical protein
MLKDTKNQNQNCNIEFLINIYILNEISWKNINWIIGYDD